LLNLTTSTKVSTNLSLLDIYHISNAKFKLKFKDKFVCFSPERFIKIENNQIFTYPMKGTIDASIKDAKEKILDNKKELAEHTMAVDLLRNDLNMVSKDVKLEKFRYISKLETDTKILYQVSSKISGNLGQNWQNRVGDILDTLLPAGSISGTPKKMSIKLIEEIEEHSRDWFSGVFGYFDGVSLDSAVMIRYMQKDEDDFIYKSGGGITISSDIDSEYNEMKDKVYIPK